MDIYEMSKNELQDLLQENKEVASNPKSTYMEKVMADNWVALIREQLRFMENFDD